MKNLFLLTLTILLFSDMLHAAEVEAENTASTRVIAPVSVRQTTALNFGSFSSAGSPGTINEKGQSSGGVTTVSSGQAGVFTIQSLSEGNYRFQIPKAATISDRASGGNNRMKVNLFSDNEGTLVSSGNGIASSNMVVTGVLEVSANQAIGKYVGTFPATVINE